jgi:hypothetical protein
VKSLKSLLLATLLLILYALHQDIWNWDDARPLFLGFIPVGLFYHAAYSVACSLVLLLVVKLAWPRHLEDEVRREGAARGEETPG